MQFPKPLADLRCKLLLALFDGGIFLRQFTESAADILGFDDPSRQAVDLSLRIDRDEGAAVSARQLEAARLQRRFEGSARIGYCPAILQSGLGRPAINLGALGLLPFFHREGAHIAFLAHMRPRGICHWRSRNISRVSAVNLRLLWESWTAFISSALIRLHTACA